MNEYEQIPHQYQKRTILTQVEWTKRELVTHVAKRAADPRVSCDELLKDVTTTANVIKTQATHLEEESTAILGETKTLRSDLVRKGY